MKQKYKVSIHGSRAVINFPFEFVGQKYTRAEWADKRVVFTPVDEADVVDTPIEEDDTNDTD